MADNYLEKKMEDHARAAAPAPRYDRRGIVRLPFPPRVVLAVTAAAAPAQPMAAGIRALAEAGCHVALVCLSHDAVASRRAAEATGARLLPFDIHKSLEYVASTWSAPDTLLCEDGAEAVAAVFARACAPRARIIAFGTRPLALADPAVACSNAIAPSNPDPARATILLALPAATFTGVTL